MFSPEAHNAVFNFHNMLVLTAWESHFCPLAVYMERLQITAIDRARGKSWPNYSVNKNYPPKPFIITQVFFVG
jgi:hypothetical protein